MTEEQQELLKWAAKAAQIEYTVNEIGDFFVARHPWDGESRVWNPLEDDTAAGSLMNALGIQLKSSEYVEGLMGTISAESDLPKYVAEMPLEGASYRDAIVRVAAEIGKNMSA